MFLGDNLFSWSSNSQHQFSFQFWSWVLWSRKCCSWEYLNSQFSLSHAPLFTVTIVYCDNSVPYTCLLIPCNINAQNILRLTFIVFTIKWPRDKFVLFIYRFIISMQISSSKDFLIVHPLPIMCNCLKNSRSNCGRVLADIILLIVYREDLTGY